MTALNLTNPTFDMSAEKYGLIQTLVDINDFKKCVSSDKLSYNNIQND